MIRPLPEPARDIALLVTRLILGLVMFAHGFQKLFIQGIGQTTDGFQHMDIPLAIVSASFVTVVEVAGSLLLVIGGLTTAVCACMLFEMLGAAVFVHLSHGLFVQDGGFEYVAIICALTIGIGAVGPGRFSLDAWLQRRHGEHRRNMDLAVGKRVAAVAPEEPSTATGSVPAFEPVADSAFDSGSAFEPVTAPDSGPVRTVPPIPSPTTPRTGPNRLVLPAPFEPGPFESAPFAPSRPARAASTTEAAADPATEALPTRTPRAAHASR